jgi:hypothetical protein
MADSTDNIITHGLSGKVGGMLVFKQVEGKTIVGKVPVPSHSAPSDKQNMVKQKFQEAVIYAENAITDPDLKAEYYKGRKPRQSAYNIAIADFFNAPKIESINLSGYSGLAGQAIIVTATDDFKVKEVTVAIYNSDGTLVEKGNAIANTNNQLWTYTTTAANDHQHGDKIVVQASDLPGNLTESQQDL